LLWSFVGYGQNWEIWEIQGTGTTRSFVNQILTAEDNMVTIVFNNLRFVQTPDERADANKANSNGILVNLSPGVKYKSVNELP